MIELADKYDAALEKYITSGAASLSSEDHFLLGKLLKEQSARGNRARQLVNG
ncbi:MAG: hypothetical protein L0H36_02095 [bacterium]|nr:hypothetical protein [bacterium]MDN5835406.1 hypothetical protein [bacterium]